MEFLDVSCLSARLHVRVRVSLSLAVWGRGLHISDFLVSTFFTFRYSTIKYYCTKSTNPQWTTGHTYHGTGVPAITSMWHRSVRVSVSCLSVPRIKLRRLIVKIEHNQLQKQAPTYLLGPLINSPPAHPDAVLTSVVYMMKSPQELGMTYSQLSTDMQLYMQALQIKLSD